MSRVLIVDGQATGRLLLERLSNSLPGVTWIEACRTASEAIERAQTSVPDLILVDSHLSQPDGLDFIRRLRDLDRVRDVPVVLITSTGARGLRRQALRCGANDFLSKPIHQEEFRARCGNLLTVRRQALMLSRHAEYLSVQVEEATAAVQVRERDTLLRLAKAGEYRDEDTGNHILRMAKYSRIIAENLGLSEQECVMIELSSPMHDIGKIGISDTILLKPGRLSPDEMEELKRHTTIGYHILKDSPSKYLQAGGLIALAHHERFDGTGYPGGLRGEEIPPSARIIAVADVFDALTSARPYKEAWTVDEALAEIDSFAGRQFDPACVAAFRRGFGAVLEVYQELGEKPRRMPRQVRLL